MSTISDAKRAANRENAKKSTGPKTLEGKERSRANAYKHGMAGEGVVVGEELKGEAAEKAKAWAESMGVAKGGPEEWLVRRAAVDATRLEAVERCELARMEERVRRDALFTRAEGMGDVFAEYKGRELLTVQGDGLQALLTMKATTAGCDWLIRQLKEVRRKQEVRGKWLMWDFRVVQKLTGRPLRSEYNSPELAKLAVDYLLAAGIDPEQSPTADSVRCSCWDPEDLMDEGDTPGDPETIARANDRLSRFLGEQIGILEERRDMLAEIDEIDASLAADRRLVDTSAEGKLLHRYATDLLRRVHQSFDHLARLKSSRPEEAKTPPEPARNEATAKVLRPTFPMRAPLAASSLDDATTVRVLLSAESPAVESSAEPRNPSRNEATPILRHPHPTFPMDRHAAASIDASA